MLDVVGFVHNISFAYGRHASSDSQEGNILHLPRIRAYSTQSASSRKVRWIRDIQDPTSLVHSKGLALEIWLYILYPLLTIHRTYNTFRAAKPIPFERLKSSIVT